MKRIRSYSENYLQVILSFVLFIFLFPLISFGQKGKPKNNNNKKNKDINIVVNCVEYIGNGKFKANFGYDNTDTKTVTVDQPSSVVKYNNGQSKKFAVNTFLAGCTARCFQSGVFNRGQG